jgi:hypothetical protein
MGIDNQALYIIPSSYNLIPASDDNLNDKLNLTISKAFW